MSTNHIASENTTKNSNWIFFVYIIELGFGWKSVEKSRPTQKQITMEMLSIQFYSFVKYICRQFFVWIFYEKYTYYIQGIITFSHIWNIQRHVESMVHRWYRNINFLYKQWKCEDNCRINKNSFLSRWWNVMESKRKIYFYQKYTKCWLFQ